MQGKFGLLNLALLQLKQHFDGHVRIPAIFSILDATTVAMESYVNQPHVLGRHWQVGRYHLNN